MKRNLDQDTKRSPANPIELEPRSSTVDGRGSDAIIDVMSFLSSSQSVIRVLCGLADDAVMFLRSSFHSRTALIAENLFLRKQLTFYQERRVRPRRLTNAARHSLVFWSRFFEWKSALLIVKPATLIGWHREAFRLFWKWKSRRVGRPRLPVALQQMIARMVHDNPTWGEERIADELWLKLGISVSPRTVRAYWPRGDKSRHPRLASQNWKAFVRNHARVLLACDFMVAFTARFRILYIFVVMEIGCKTIRCCRWPLHSHVSSCSLSVLRV
jgi:putative transposase